MTSDELTELDTPELGAAAKRRRAVRVVAGYARDAGELAELLDMLGLSAAEGRAPEDSAPEDPEPVAIPAQAQVVPVRPEDQKVLMGLMRHAVALASARGGRG